VKRLYELLQVPDSFLSQGNAPFFFALALNKHTRVLATQCNIAKPHGQ
jgi:hypothetical protein